MGDEKLRPLLEKQIQHKEEVATYYGQAAEGLPKRLGEVLRAMAQDERENAMLLRWALDKNFSFGDEWPEGNTKHGNREQQSHRIIVWRPFPET